MIKEKNSTKHPLNYRKKTKLLNSLETEVAHLKEISELNKRRTNDMMSAVIKEIGEIGVAVGNHDSTFTADPTAASFDEEMTMARLFISRLKNDVKQLANKCQTLQLSQDESLQQQEESEQQLAQSKLLVQQHEAKMKSLMEYMKDVENKKRGLEESVDKLNADIAQLRTVEQQRISTDQETMDQLKSSEEIQSVMKEQLDSQRDIHQAQLSKLRDEIDEKKTMIESLTDNHQKLYLENEKLQADYDKLRIEEKEKENKLKELHIKFDRREQARQDLKGLEETVSRELQSLHNLRKLFVRELNNKVKKQLAGDDVDDVGGSIVQKQKISFLEGNLDQLTKVHKQLVRDNADLRCELPKLEKRLRATAERVKALEQALRDAKEGAMRDRRRYQHEVDRIKEAVRAKNMARRGHAAQIAKPIRPGGSTGGSIRGGGQPVVSIRGGGRARTPSSPYEGPDGRKMSSPISA